MYLIDRQDGLQVRYDGQRYSIRVNDIEIDSFVETRDRSLPKARSNALRYLRRRATHIEKRKQLVLGTVTTKP